MDIIRSPVEMTAWADKIIGQGGSVSLVPTMGYFHEGHLALMRKAGELARHVVVSLFVNPIQFGPGEDLQRYPKDFERDVSLARREKVDVIFAPTVEDMYPAPILTRVSVGRLTDTLCGVKRPGHFDGVATVVAKLFHIVKPHSAVFGKKDFQQLAVIKRMVMDLNWDIDIVGHPIVRESDGLAMSSRNTYLSPAERKSALCLYRAIRLARNRVREGLRDVRKLKAEIMKGLQAQSDVAIDYVQIVDKDSLADQETLNGCPVLAMAVRIGKTRLIDNAELFEGD